MQKVEYSDQEENETSSEEQADDAVSEADDSPLDLPFTQFYCSQIPKDLNKQKTNQTSVWNSDMAEVLNEALERTNGKLDLGQLESLSEEEIIKVACELEKTLSPMGTYNLCCSINAMSVEQRIRYLTAFYSHVLLPKIISQTEPSRLLSSAITECVERFPDDAQKLIFIPLLNADLKDTTLAKAVANGFDPQRNPVLVTNFLATVRELKSWHIPILQGLLSMKTDHRTNDKIIELFSENALHFAEDKNFGKLVLSFLKTNTEFSKEQKISLQEIADIMQTLFKKPIQNIINNI